MKKKADGEMHLNLPLMAAEKMYQTGRKAETREGRGTSRNEGGE